MKSDKIVFKIRSERSLRKAIKSLGKMRVESADPFEARIAQAMETAIVWATTKTQGWDKMDAEARIMAGILRKEMTQ